MALQPGEPETLSCAHSIGAASAGGRSGRCDTTQEPSSCLRWRLCLRAYDLIVAVSDAPGSLALVLDTNVLVSDWLLESPAGTHIRSQSLYGPITLIVPELVVREVVRVYRRKLKGAQRELRNAIVLRRKLQAGAPDPALDQVVTDVNVDAA